MKIELTHGESFYKVVPIARLSKTGEEGKALEVSGKLNIYKDGKLEYTTDLEKQDSNFIIDISEDDIMMFTTGDYRAEIEITHGKKKQKQSLDLSIAPYEQVDFFDSEENVNKDKEMKIYFQEPIDVAIDSFFSDKDNVEKFIAPFIPIVEDGYTPRKGVDYDDGYTPIKGKDYFDGVDGETPRKGVDYFTDKEILEIKKALKKSILEEMPDHATKEEVNIKFEDILKKIKNLPKGGGGALFLRQLMDVNVGTPTAQQYGLTYNPSRSEFSLTSITGGGSSVSVNGVEVTDPNFEDTAEIAITATGSDVNFALKNGSIDENKLDTSVNTSLDLADSALQSSAIGVSVQAYSSVLQNTTASFTTTDETKLDNITVTQAVNLDTMESDIAALANGMVYKGNWDASAGTFPGAGSAQTGWFYTVSVGGTVDSVVFNVGDRLIATTDNASTTTYAGNWTQLDATDAVTSVFSRTGNVVSANGDYTASQITNVPAGNIAATEVQAALNELDGDKQATLVSGTNIKTINGSSILGSGDLTVSGTMAIGGSITSATSGSVLFAGASGVLQQDNTNLFWDDTNNLLGVGTNAPSTSYRMDIKSTSTSLAGLRVYGGGPTGGGAQAGSGEIRLGNGATDFGNLAYNNQSGNVYLDNGYSGGSIFLRVGGVSLLGTSSTGATANASTSSGTGLVVGGGSSLENHLLGGEIRLGISPGAENVLLAYGASTGDFYLKNVYSGGKFRFYIGSTQHMTLFSSGALSIGTTAETAKLSIIKTTEQLRVGYDASNYFSATVGSTGGVTFDAVGSGAGFTFSDDVSVPDEAYGAGWNGSLEVPTKNAVYDKIETLGGGANTALSNLSGVAINTSLVSDTDNTDNLGSSLIRWATGFFTNLGATATRIVQGWFTDIESTNMPTVGGTPILSSLTAPQFTTVELGHASDTTLSRVSAGVVAVEGKTLANLTDGGTFAADISVPDEAYGSGWNGSTEVPTKNAVYDKIQTMSSAWSLRSYSTATATSITVSSLNLTTDNNHYRVIVDMNYSTVSERDLLQCQINGITTSDTYGTVGHGRSMDFSAGTGTARTINYLGAQWRFNAVGGNNAHMVMDFYSTKTDSGTARITGTYNMTSNYEDAGAEDFSNYEGAVFQNSQTNITSLRFFHNGSEQKVWRVWVLYPATS